MKSQFRYTEGLQATGMKGHFEVGITLEPKESNTLADILQSLRSKTDLFARAWDSAECVGRDG